MRISIGWLAAAALLAATAPASGAPPGPGACADAIDPASPVLSNGFASNLSNTRNTPSSIDSTNVAGLRVALAHAAVGTDEKRGAPAVTAQAVFFSAGLSVIAMNRRSGCQYWSHTIPERIPPRIGGSAVRSSAIYYLNEGPPAPALVLAGDSHGFFYAIDAVTGSLVWSRFLGNDPANHIITGAPQFHDGKMFVPISSKEVITAPVVWDRICCTSHGMLHAVDPYTGETIWIYHTSANATFHPLERKFAPNGMSMWGTPAVDPARGLIYVGTGQNLTPPTTDNSDSIIALDLDTGKPRWVFQATAGDAYNAGCSLLPPLDRDCVRPAGPDFDFGAPPILVRLDDGVDAIIAGSKNGVVYSLDPDTGRVNWSRRVGAGGRLGGIHWGMAVDATRVYAAVSDVTVNKAAGAFWKSLLLRAVIWQVRNATPGIYALDLKTGARVWSVHPRHVYQGRRYDSIHSAALSVTNDVVLAGSLDGVVRALRSSDGRELWSHDTTPPFIDVRGQPGAGGSIDSVGAIVAETDALVNSGYNSFGRPNEFQAGPGNALLIFRLPEEPDVQ